MVEQKLEAKLITALTTALTAASVSGIETVGSWQTAAANTLKGVESGSALGILTVKVLPRQYETFTIAEATIDAEVTLHVRADASTRGVDYLNAADVVSSVLTSYQRTFSTFSAAFSISNEFTPTGFRLDGGDCGLDRDSAVWVYRQKITIQGIL